MNVTRTFLGCLDEKFEEFIFSSVIFLLFFLN